MSLTNHSQMSWDDREEIYKLKENALQYILQDEMKKNNLKISILNYISQFRYAYFVENNKVQRNLFVFHPVLKENQHCITGQRLQT